jgi:hypothetical protein
VGNVALIAALVVLTRAGQGMILFIPKGEASDHTRPPAFYNGTFEYLRSCGITRRRERRDSIVSSSKLTEMSASV